MSVFDSALADMEQIAVINDSHMLGGVIAQYRAAETDHQRVNVLVAAIGVYDGLLRRVEGQAATLQAIADAEPAANTRAYDERCDGCLRLIAMAREGIEAT